MPELGIVDIATFNLLINCFSFIVGEAKNNYTIYCEAEKMKYRTNRHNNHPKPKRDIYYMRRALKVGVLAIALSFSTSQLWAARIFVPELELFIRASLFNNGAFAPRLETLANLDIDIEASDKIGVRIRLGHTGNLSEGLIVGNQLVNDLISLDLISLTVGEPFVTPVYVEIFSGEHDKIGSGDDFERLFNVDGVASFFRGYLYFNDGELYDALHTINGTGVVVASEFGSDFASARLYIYKDTPFITSSTSADGTTMLQVQDAGSYSVDLRAMFDVDIAQVDLYFGGTLNSTPNAVSPALPSYSLRTGLMANFGSFDELFQFFIHFGIPYLRQLENATSAVISFSDFQALAEARFNIEDVFGLHFTFLIRPFYYNNALYGDPKVDINSKLFFGSYDAEFGRGGFDLRVSLDSSFVFESLSVIPFFGFTAGGITWDLGANFEILPFEVNRFLDSLNISISAKAVL